MRRERVSELVRDVAAVARERRLGLAAAGLAYHAFNTLVPLVILSLVGVSIAGALEPILETLLGGTVLEGAVTDADIAAAGDGSARTRAGLLATGILLWSATRLFQAINNAFAAVYDAEPEESYVSTVTTVTLVTALNTVLVTATVAAAVVLVGVIGVGVPTGGERWAAVLSPVLLVGLLFVVFLPMYYLFPRPDVSIREVVPGTAVAALGWTALAVGFRFYVTTAESVALFGVAGALLLVLTWVYLGGFCLLLGAVLNAVLADRVDPETEWVPLQTVRSKYA